MPFDGTTYDETLELLRRGRERVVAGWCRGPARTPDGRVCAWGAVLYDPVDQRQHTHQAMTALFRALPWWHRIGLAGDARSGVICYNEAPLRRQDQIVRLYDRAIARQSKGGRYAV